MNPRLRIPLLLLAVTAALAIPSFGVSFGAPWAIAAGVVAVVLVSFALRGPRSARRRGSTSGSGSDSGYSAHLWGGGDSDSRDHGGGWGGDSGGGDGGGGGGGGD